MQSERIFDLDLHETKNKQKNEEKVKTKRLRTVKRKVKQKQTIKKQNKQKRFFVLFCEKNRCKNG
jgi:predicted GNAT family acetyltransferase